MAEMTEDCNYCTKKRKVQIDISPYVTMISPKPNFEEGSKGAIEYCSIDWFLTLICSKNLTANRQILENLSRIFSEISVFRGVTQTDSWKTHPVFFRKYFK